MINVTVTNAKTKWPESLGWMLERKNIGNQYIFLHYHSPVKVYTANGIIRTKGNTFIILGKYGYQNFEVIEKNMTHDWMHIQGNLDELMKQSGLLYNVIYNLQNSTFITKITHDIELELTNPDEYSNGIIQSNIEKLLLLIGRSVNSRENITEPKVRNDILSARSIIHRYYYEEWDIDKMANLIHMSRSRFSELYTQVIGVSPKKDLQNIRIEHAKYMLITTGDSIKNIAKSIGYDTEYYFIRRFKELTGKTPGEYRRSETNRNQ